MPFNFNNYKSEKLLSNLLSHSSLNNYTILLERLYQLNLIGY